MHRDRGIVHSLQAAIISLVDDVVIVADHEFLSGPLAWWIVSKEVDERIRASRAGLCFLLPA